MMFADKHFLYVEDDPLSREVMQMIMNNGMGVTNLNILEDSTDFMSRLKALEVHPNIILLDVHVKPYNGMDMLRMLRADPEYNHIPVVALTASVMNEEVEQLRTSGFDGAIGKPLSVTTFPDLVGRIMAGESVWHVT
ncbi:MAG: response regulator [Anaerolineae bacterium]|nr:response regulator [Anaerolineae bacterium]